MKKNASLFATLTSLLFIITFIFNIVSAIKALSDLSGTTLGGKLGEYMRSCLVFELIAGILLLILAIVTIILMARSASDKSLYVSTSITLGVLSIYSIIDTFLAYGLLKKMYGDYVSMPGGSIAKLILLFIAVILIAVSLFLQSSYVNDDKANIPMIMACVCLFICCIIAFGSMDSYTTGLIITTTVFLLLSVISAGYFFINSYGEDPRKARKRYSSSTYRPSSTSSYNNLYNSPSTGRVSLAKSPSTTSDVDPVVKLRELKKLLDDGVISQDEYELKRKKYIDKL